MVFTEKRDWGLAWVLELETGNTHFALVTVTFSQFQNNQKLNSEILSGNVLRTFASLSFLLAILFHH